MARSKTINDAVYVAEEPIVCMSRNDAEFLKARVGQNERKRVRLCAHKDTEDRLQEMLIAFDRNSYIRPSKHINKEESMHIVEGIADFIFFDEEGNVTDVIPLGDYFSGRRFYCRTPDSVYHTLLIRSDTFIIQETTQGPFQRSDTVFAPWAPQDQDTAGVGKYMECLAVKVKNFRSRQSI